jgi:predicted enzyme related to lactoylglutathione lyase
VAFAAVTPSDDWEQPPQPEGAVGTAVWHELATIDYEAAFGFYEQLFGWQKTESMDMGEGNMYQMDGLNRPDSLSGIFNKPPEMSMAAWNIYWEVADVDVAATKVVELGGTVVNGPMEVPGGGRIL